MIWSSLLPLFARGGVYVSGFLLIFSLSNILGPQRFGYYSVIQSFSELFVLILGFGVYQAFPRLILQGKGRVTFGDVLLTLFVIFSFAIAISFIFLFGAEIKLPFPWFFAIAINVLIYSLLLVMLGIQRGYGKTFLFNFESAIRSVVVLVFLLSFSLLGFDIDLGDVLFFLLFSYSVVIFFVIISFDKEWVERSLGVKVGVGERFHLFIGSIMSFFVRKSDIIVFSTYVSILHISAYKIAFLLAEAPSQFVQAYVISKIHRISPDGGIESQKLYRKYLLQVLLLGGGMIFCFYIALRTLLYFEFYVSSDVVSIYLILAPYFFARCYTVCQELFLSIYGNSIKIRNRVFIEMLSKLSLFLFVYLLFEDNPEYLYLFLLFIEVLIFEISVKREFGFFPFFRIIGWSSDVKKK